MWRFIKVLLLEFFCLDPKFGGVAVAGISRNILSATKSAEGHEKPGKRCNSAKAPRPSCAWRWWLWLRIPALTVYYPEILCSRLTVTDSRFNICQVAFFSVLCGPIPCKNILDCLVVNALSRSLLQPQNQPYRITNHQLQHSVVILPVLLSLHSPAEKNLGGVREVFEVLSKRRCRSIFQSSQSLWGEENVNTYSPQECLIKVKST